MTELTYGRELSSRHSLRGSDAIAIGAGPSNLSLAALADSVSTLSVRVLEARSSAAWHPGLLLPRSRLQGSFLRDLVTPIDPRSEYTFLNFLHVKRRLNGFLAVHQENPLRVEFSEYLEWVADRVSTSFNDRVLDIAFDGNGFTVESELGTQQTKHIVVGAGAKPYAPNNDWLELNNVWHTSEHLTAPRDTAAKRVVIIGGGQSAAEVFLHLLDKQNERPRKLTWFTGRNGLKPRDESVFTDIYFQPSYAWHFSELSAPRRAKAAARAHSAISGVSDDVLREIYSRMYAFDVMNFEEAAPSIVPSSEVVALERSAGDSISVTIHDIDREIESAVEADVVILATGYQKRIPEFLSSLLPRLQVSDGSIVTDGLGRAYFDGPSANGVYMHAGPSSSAGVGGQALGLVAWRSAQILNNIAGEEIFNLSSEWSAHSCTVRRPE